jgi:NAD(P)-dependent dehydrogenase (short-subunit alcohol dehydrogenase family)
VTGGSRGIGRAISRLLARAGARVAFSYLSDEASANSLVKEIRAEGGEAMALAADVSRPADARQMVRDVVAAWQRLDILVNNAGVFAPTPLAETRETQWDAILDSNLKSHFFCAQRAAPMLARSGRGRIVNLASLGGLLAWPQYTAYSVSKAGVIMLTRCLARALAPAVTVNAVAPGTISFPEDAPELAEQYIRRAPLARTGTADDIAGAVLYLVSAAFVTGQVLVVDGGRSIPS